MRLPGTPAAGARPLPHLHLTTLHGSPPARSHTLVCPFSSPSTLEQPWAGWKAACPMGSSASSGPAPRPPPRPSAGLRAAQLQRALRFCPVPA